MTQPTISLENVPETAFTRILNFRRNKEKLTRREGWIKFAPTPGAPSPATQSVFDASETLTHLTEAIRPNGERVVVGCGRTLIKKFNFATLLWVTIGSGFSAQGKRWASKLLNGYLVFNNQVDLPVTWRVEEANVVPIYEMRQSGIASCECIEVYNGFLFVGNIREIAAENLNTVMNGVTPYGTVSDSLVNHLPTVVAWSEFTEPRRWAPTFDVVMAAASATIVLPFAIGDTLVAGETRVAVINGGPNGGTLGGQEDTPLGVLITTIVGSTITLEKSTTAGLTYPRTVTVTRWSDVSSLVGKADLQGDTASEITALKVLDTGLIIYRRLEIYVGRYVGTIDQPFAFRPKYAGTNVPIWGDAIGSVMGEYHLYPATGGRWIKFDGVSNPEIQQKCDNARDLFFSGITYAEECFAVSNPMTKEIWFCRSGKTFAYDTEYHSVSEIDKAFDALAFVQRPGSTDLWFILGIGRYVFTYALVEGATQITTFLRDGVTPAATLKSGLLHGGDQRNEKKLDEFTPIMGSSSPNCAISVQIRSTWNPNADLEDLLVPVHDLPSPEGDNYIPLHYLATYFQHEINVTDTRDVDVNFTAFIYILDGIRAGGITRSRASLA